MTAYGSAAFSSTSECEREEVASIAQAIREEGYIHHDENGMHKVMPSHCHHKKHHHKHGKKHHHKHAKKHHHHGNDNASMEAEAMQEMSSN